MQSVHGLKKDKAGFLFLKAGLVFAFLYPPIAAFFDPASWIGYFPLFMRESIHNDLLLLNLFGALEISLALWILFGKRIFYPSIIAASALIVIVVSNWNNFDVLFRDLSVAALAIALAIFNLAEQQTT